MLKFIVRIEKIILLNLILKLAHFFITKFSLRNYFAIFLKKNFKLILKDPQISLSRKLQDFMSYNKIFNDLKQFYKSSFYSLEISFSSSSPWFF